jgi:hypothetical protein
MDTVADLAARWPTFAAFADDAGVEWATAHQWRLRNRIPPDHWPAIIAAAHERGFSDVTAESMLAMTVNMEQGAA